MLHVVQADAEDVLARPGDGRQQLHIGQRHGDAHWPAALVLREQAAGAGNRGGSEVDEGQHVVGQRMAAVGAEQLQVDHEVVHQGAEARGSGNVGTESHETHG
ncbi:hypothetical protein D9M69_627430 [compost metagenome]